MTAQPKIEYKERRKVNIPVADDTRINNRQPTRYTTDGEKHFINRLGEWYNRSRFSKYAKRDTLLLNYSKAILKRADLSESEKLELSAHAMKQYHDEYGRG